MATVQPVRQIARYDLTSISTNDEVKDPNPTFTPASTSPSSSSSTSNSKTFPWPHLFWIGLAILISIALIITVVVPIAVFANTGNSTTRSTICSTTAITTTVTSNSLPAQCRNYTLNLDETRRPTYTASSTCDYEAFDIIPTWVRFEEPAGTLLATCPMTPNTCGTQFAGWYTGLFPSTAGEITYGVVCYVSDTDLCFETSRVVITNCNGYYVFYLRDPPFCDMRYCTI